MLFQRSPNTLPAQALRDEELRAAMHAWYSELFADEHLHRELMGAVRSRVDSGVLFGALPSWLPGAWHPQDGVFRGGRAW